MKLYVREFIRRGFVACGFGPIVLAIFYFILQRQGAIHYLTVNQVCLGIVSLSALAFIAGGMNAIYQIEQLPLMLAIFIHGTVLYCSYLVVYLINGWLQGGVAPIFVFTCIFIVGYFIIWIIIYTIMKQKTNKLNEILNQKHQLK